MSRTLDRTLKTPATEMFAAHCGFEVSFKGTTEFLHRGLLRLPSLRNPFVHLV
jgi:hypothetical protein